MPRLSAAWRSACFCLLAASAASAELPSFEKVSGDFKKLEVSDQSEKKGLFDVWKHDERDELLGELPKNFAGKRYFVALTLSAGDRYAGLQSGDWVVEFRKYDDRLAVLSPNLDVRAEGDAEAKASVQRLFTDRVLLDMPILAIGPSGGPVIDLDEMLTRRNTSVWFGPQVRVSNLNLVAIDEAKVFPKNIELSFELVGQGGQLQTVHYSFSEVPPPSGSYKAREADERVGYFTTAFSDLSKYEDDDTRVRYINRWHLEKRDAKLKLSPPKEPIRFYVEHTAPVRYRRWIKAGVDYWNKAFEKVGIDDAIVIEYQDAQSGIHMEKDPEDVRYNFIRWLNNDIGTAIGPSRVHPITGQILDADIVLTDGWIRYFNFNYEDLMPRLAMEGMSAESLAWLGRHPSWDPRVRLGAVESSEYRRRQFAAQSAEPMAGYKLAATDPALLGDQEYDGLIGHLSQKNGLCMAAEGRSMDLAMARMNWMLVLEDEKDKEKKEEKEEKSDNDNDNDNDKDKDKDKELKKDLVEDDAKAETEDSDENEDEQEADDKVAGEGDKDESELLDGMPEWFVGPLLADLVAHEVGHTLGLRHNFKASGQLTLAEINSEKIKGERTFAASVMDYIPINYRYDVGEVQGDYAMIDIGPYDLWAIEYGYTFDDKKLDKILQRCSEPELQYATDEDTSGPDPLARRYDFAADPLTYAQEQMKLVKLYREKLLERFVDDGDSWSKARRGYELTLSVQMRSVSMMANWIGGAFINRDKKGDPGDRKPVVVVPAEDQRNALDFVIATSFRDDAYGLTPEILERMGVDKWLDGDGHRGMTVEATWPIHDRILDMQASTMTLLLNPTTLRRVYDNELRLPTDQDALTLPELLQKVTDAVWTELAEECPKDRNNREPAVSSLRRNLQREHLQRLIDLILDEPQDTAVYNPITNLARMQLRTLQSQLGTKMSQCGGGLDAYTMAHLTECQQRIEKALAASYTYGGSAQGGPIMMLMFGKDGQPIQP